MVSSNYIISKQQETITTKFCNLRDLNEIYDFSNSQMTCLMGHQRSMIGICVFFCAYWPRMTMTDVFFKKTSATNDADKLNLDLFVVLTARTIVTIHLVSYLEFLHTWKKRKMKISLIYSRVSEMWWENFVLRKRRSKDHSE